MNESYVIHIKRKKYEKKSVHIIFMAAAPAYNRNDTFSFNIMFNIFILVIAWNIYRAH